MKKKYKVYVIGDDTKFVHNHWFKSIKEAEEYIKKTGLTTMYDGKIFTRKKDIFNIYEVEVKVLKHVKRIEQ